MCRILCAFGHVAARGRVLGVSICVEKMSLVEGNRIEKKRKRSA